ncbi:MAG TPA: hypothetical protein VHN37_00685 [Actinomycetota bacterium]|nr:hypothetical protein [Actinomycetota bacterium]
MIADAAGHDPVPSSAYPSFQTVTGPPPEMPASWSGVALLHPFSPPLSSDPEPDTPFFQLCVANVVYQAGAFLDVQIAGCDYGTWWYSITPNGTELSTDEGKTWTTVDMGWSLPSNWFGAQIAGASCAGASPLNWMPGPVVDWWKVPVPIPDSPPAATWMWFDHDTGAPVRIMFGEGPPTPVMGDPQQLAFFQMYSFTYFPVFEVNGASSERPGWSSPTFPGFQVGNPSGYQNFEWNPNFGMTAFMTPVNEKFDPLPTRVLYVWKPDSEYEVFSDRAQHTRMLYDYNLGNPPFLAEQVALLTGPAPAPPPPPDSDEGFLINYYSLPQLGPTCIGGSEFPFPQEPPTWVSIPAVEGTIRATITDNPVVAPGTIVTVFSVLFPPAPPNYPEATYLWTWYSPLEPTGVSSRPVTFMQSQSGVGVGTSLALADYFYYEEFADPIDPANFAIPPACSLQTRKHGLRRRLP